ncbi:MAG: penicillin-binding protein activator LpoB [Nitrospirales bacterium]|nr:penicillin-binding protein activator LpoB [Nitrospirales bacterium]
MATTGSARIFIGAALAVTFAFSGGCASTSVSRVDAATTTDLSGRWNDTDSRLVAEGMIKEALSQPWLSTFTNATKKPPVVVVGTVVNRSTEHINVQAFISDLERELTNSGKVTFVAGKGQREEIREERREQAANALESTQKPPGKEIGADYLLRGSIISILDEAEGTKAIFYQVDLEMVDISSNVKSWFGQKKIKKVVERKRVIF